MADEQDQLLNEYTELLSQLADSPAAYPLHLEHLRLTHKLALPDELNQARGLFLQHYALPKNEWDDWLSTTKAAVDAAGSDEVEPHITMIELYKRASSEYLSIPLLIDYSLYFINSYYASLGISPPSNLSTIAQEEEEDDEEEAAAAPSRQVGEPNLVLGAVFELDEVRIAEKEVLSLAGAHIARSGEVWNLWKVFELDLLKREPSSEQVAHIDAMYIARLKQPHLNIEKTFSQYSHFISTHLNASYNTKLPAANKSYANSEKQATEREAQEAKLVAEGNSVQGYLDYGKWEMEVKNVNVPLVSHLWERATSDFPENVEIWLAYLEFSAKKPGLTMPIAEKAVRHVPGSHVLWENYFLAAEKARNTTPALELLFTRATDTSLMEDVESLVGLYEARAGFQRREVEKLIENEEEVDGSVIDDVVGVLLEGIKRVRTVEKKGDLAGGLRLEKHLIRLLERFNRIDEVTSIWEDLTKTYPTSSVVWYGRADFETRAGDLKSAHKVYQTGCTQKSLDYPEYLLEAWLAFEKHSGTLDDLEYTVRKVGRQKKGLEAKRMREAIAAAQQAEAEKPAEQFIEDAVMATAAEDKAEGKKRERSPAVGEDKAEGKSKKAKVEGAPAAPTQPAEPKRDRENSTVFVVATSDASMGEQEVSKLFNDCGEVRESKIKRIGSKDYAMIEFVDKESVGMAQTKDKKKINGVEVEVHIAWKSCLYVTNYPESYDKEKVEKLFSKYGTIFDTRWPSKKFRDTRRFCYVQFTSPDDAVSALELHGSELQPGIKLNVYISDPAAKTRRTDAGANQKELYIANLARSVREFDLKKLFEPYGAIKGIRVPTDDKGDAKGFAFVEFEEESAAKASLALHNHELKKRHLSVTIAQSRVVGTHKEGPREPRAVLDSRRVRVSNIKAGTEEAIVQQAFEKIASVKQVLMDAGSTDAVVELVSQAEAGKVLLVVDSVLVDGEPVVVVAESHQARIAAEKKAAAPPRPTGADSDAVMRPRQMARGRGRGRVGLGARGGRPGLGAGGAAASSGASMSSAPGGEAAPKAGAKSQDDFRALLAKK
ncbi:pre-mrna splicing factor 24 [Pseudohyphozyma bogoriensis]|nr:pre-mrna splicing factor 24 [Pseudohyphozyma bogoriensis]